MFTPHDSPQNDDLARGSTLYKECQSDLKPTGTFTEIDYSEAAYCTGYLSGFTDGLDPKESGICDNGVNMGTIARVYVVFMHKNPRLLDAPKSTGLFKALRDAYPCPAK